MKNNSIIIIPCSGIGKPLGTVARQAVFEVTESSRPNEASTLCLALLTVGDEEAQKKVTSTSCISVDGCPSQCASKNIEASGGSIAHSFILTQYMREHRDLKPKGIIELNNEGQELASRLAQDITQIVDQLVNKEETSSEA